MRNNKAFTLIDLLVVVLIIGILAAIALPQYQKAVEKTRISTMFPVLKSIVEANEIYYMENNAYTGNVENLSVHLPANCAKIDGGGQLWSCGTDFVFDNSGEETILNYCPGNNATYDACHDSRDVIFLVRHQHTSLGEPGKWICAGNTAKGLALCSALGY